MNFQLWFLWALCCTFAVLNSFWGAPGAATPYIAAAFVILAIGAK